MSEEKNIPGEESKVRFDKTKTINMKYNSIFFKLLFVCVTAFILPTGCTTQEKQKVDPVEANIKMYKHTWDEIINKGKLDMFNDSNFTKDVVMHANPDIVGIDSARAYYANYLTGFSNITFTIID